MSTVIRRIRPARSPALLWAALALAIGAALPSATALASGFQLKENSAQALGRAFAGSAAAPGDAAVVVNNPAAMSDLPGTVVQGDVTAINFSTHFSGTGDDALGRPLSGGAGGDGGTTQPVPAFYFAMPLADRWHVGAAFSVPFGFITEYDDGWIGRYQAYKSELQTLALTLSASYALSDQFSLGASLIAQRTKADLSSAVDFGAILAGPTGGLILPQQADGRARVVGHDWGYGWQLGALWKPTDSDRLGFDYHAKVRHTLSGSADFTVPATVAPLLGPAFRNSAADADFDTPASVTLSWWHTWNDRLSFGADVAWTGWSSFRQLRVDYANPAQPPTIEAEDWSDTLFGSLGVEYQLDPRWSLRGGVAVDGTPTSLATRSPRVPDGTRRWITFGVGFQPSDQLQWNLGYAHLFVNDAHVNDLSATQSTLVGRFADKGNLLGVSGQYRF